MVLEHEVSESKGELKGESASSIDSPELIAALIRLPTKVALLEHQNERLQNEHKMELEKLTSSFETALALKNDKIKRLEDEIVMLREAANGRNADGESDNQEVEESTEEDGNDEVANLPKLNDVTKKSDLRGPKQETTFDECLQLLMDRMRTDHKKELNQMSSTFKTALAFKNRKIKNLEKDMGWLREVEEENSEENLESKSDNFGGLADASMYFKFENVSKLTSEPIHFKPAVLNGVEWVVSLHKNGDYLACTATGKAISGGSFPKAIVDFDVLCEDEYIDTFYKQSKERMIHEGTHFYKNLEFISFKDLFDKKNKLVVNDAADVSVHFAFIASEN